MRTLLPNCLIITFQVSSTFLSTYTRVPGYILQTNAYCILKYPHILDSTKLIRIEINHNIKDMKEGYIHCTKKEVFH